MSHSYRTRRIRLSLASTLLGLLVTLAPGTLAAQVVASERATFTQQIAGTTIELDFSRPSVRGRAPVFGGVVPWGKVWTPGANLSTRLRVSDDVRIGGEDLPAGTYGVWLQVLEDAPWRLVLHKDTTLFHTQNPTVDEGFVVVPVATEPANDFTENLVFDLQRIRADGADLVLSWGDTRAAVRIDVDPGFVLTVEPAEAERYVGTWSLDETASRTPDEQLARWLESPTIPEANKRLMQGMAEAQAEPREIEIVYDVDTGRLMIVDPVMATLFAPFQGAADADPRTPTTQLVPRAEGIFLQGQMLRGELSGLSENVEYWEFTFDDDGRAVAFERRGGRQDQLRAEGHRSGTAGSP